MSARPAWIEAGQRPIFSMLHVPAGGLVRGAVVLCPTLGIEAVSAHRALRVLAERLEDAGLLVCRVDYDGTANSAGAEHDPGRLEAWIDSVRAAIGFVRAAGAAAVGVVGLRIGATIATSAVAEEDVDALVLWDPCPRGRSFVREQQALKAMSIGDTPTPSGAVPDGAVEVLGSVLSAEVVAALGGLDMATAPGRLARRVLVLTRADRSLPGPFVSRLDAAGAEWAEALGQAELIDAMPDSALVPDETVARIVEWTGKVLDGPTRELSLSVRDRAVLAAEDGSPIEERALRLGPLGLFGVRTAPTTQTRAPTVVFLNAGLIPHVGPGRLWVTLARRLAAAGIPSLRVDLSGLGESPVRPGQAPQIDYPLEALDDVAAIVDAVSPGDPSGVVLAGLCAGAYHSIEAGIALGVRAVYAINPILNFDPPEVRDGGELAPARNAVRPHNRWIKLLLGHRGLVDFGDRHVPPVVWAALQRLHLHCSPARGLEQLAERGVWTMLVCGDMEARQFDRRARGATRRLEAEGTLRLERLTGGDHSLFGAAARAAAADLVAGSVVSRYAPATPAPRPSRGPAPAAASVV
ncbi:MAG TPA: alpha/beta hydrolase family protein [Acidimicrobiales bacterium]|nr:alpha/beta hydrolase family protein [Acidimicrobiales bacterium]